MTLCQIKNPRLVLICCLNNSTRGIFIIPSQEETILNLEILRQVGRGGRFWLTGTIRIPTNVFSWMTGVVLLVNYPCSPKTSPRALVPVYLYLPSEASLQATLYPPPEFVPRASTNRPHSLCVTDLVLLTHQTWLTGLAVQLTPLSSAIETDALDGCPPFTLNSHQKPRCLVNFSSTSIPSSSQQKNVSRFWLCYQVPS